MGEKLDSHNRSEGKEFWGAGGGGGGGAERESEMGVSQQVCQGAGKTLLHMCVFFSQQS